MEDRRFIVKITCKGSSDAGGEVLRIIESLGVEITYTALDKIKPMLVLVTIFIRVSFFPFSSFSFNENKQTASCVKSYAS